MSRKVERVGGSVLQAASTFRPQYGWMRKPLLPVNADGT